MPTSQSVHAFDFNAMKNEKMFFCCMWYLTKGSVLLFVSMYGGTDQFEFDQYNNCVHNLFSSDSF